MHRALLLLLAMVFPALAQDVRITEFMPANTAGIQDQDATFQPWIEVWNASPVSKVILTNWRLVHGASQWTFPAGMEIPPDEYLVVFASGKNRTTMTAPLHTNFTLNPAGGGPLQLVRSDSVVASSFASYPALPANVSYGRDRAELTQVGTYTNPTPGNANNYSGSGVSGKLTMSVSSRAFIGSLSVSLTEVTPVAGAVIRYTTNGVAPTSTSTQFNPATPISVSTTSLLRARVFEPGKLPGEIETAGYLLLDGTTANFNTATPLVVVSNFGLGTFPDTGDQPAYMWVWEPGVDGRARFSNLPTLATRVAVDRRGSSTLGNPKTNFNLEARKARDDDDRDINLLSMGEGADWVFHAPYNFDRSLLHNPFMYALSNAIGRAAMRSRMAEVFVETTGASLSYTGSSSGDYYGLYNVMQKIRRAPDRIDVAKLDTYDNDAVGKTGGYIFKVDRQDGGDTGFSAGGMTLAYYYPKEVEMKSPPRDPQEAYLTSYINSFKAALDSVNYKDPNIGYAAWLDVPAAVDHHLLNVWSFNVDALRLSGYLHKDRNGKIVYGPIWDFDRTLSSTDSRDDNPATWRSQVSDLGTDFFNYPWWGRMFTDPDFYQKYIDRWVELRRGMFAPAAVNALLDNLNAELTAEGVARDLARWNQTKRDWTSPFTGFYYAASQAAEVQRIKDYLQQRANFFDSQWVAPVTLSKDGGSVTPGTTVTMSAAGGSTIYYTLNGSDPRPNGGGVPTSPNVFTYTGPITVDAITRIKARAYNPNWTALTGPNNPPLVSKWSGLRDVRLAVSPAAVPGDLAVTEVNYHPPDPSAAELAVDPTFTSQDFEFIELKNVSATPVDLAGIQISVGASFTFTNDAAFTLQPGEYVVIADNPAALAARYGNVANVVGGFSGDLNNLGEQIVIRSAANEVIADFIYADTWYPATDGDGPTLEGRDQTQLSAAAGWRASLRMGGTPGFDDVPAAITEDPAPSTVNPGQPISLTVEFSGFPAPTFQWRKDGDNIEGATGATYGVLSATEADEGSYDVVVQNFSGTATSTPVAVMVNDPVVFTTHPQERVVNPGTLVTFTTVANGTAPLSYQWRKGGAPIDGATSSSLEITAEEAHEGTYDVVVSNIVGPVASNPASLLVNDPVVIDSGPVSKKINPQGSVTFSVSVSGTAPFEYQWRKGGAPLPNANGPELVIFPATEADEGTYDVVVSNIVGPITSGGATLEVNDPVQFVSGPTDQTVNSEESVTFSVTVGGTGPFTYQWRKGGVPIEGAVNADFTITSAAESDEGNYDVIVTNDVGPATSGIAVLTVNHSVEFVTQPVSRAVSPGGTAIFTVSVTGSGEITYQWRRNQVALDGETSASLQISGVSEANLGTYDVVVTNVAGPATSAPAELSFIDWAVAAGNYQGALVRLEAENPAADFYPGRLTAKISKTGKVTGKLEYMGLPHAFKAQFDVELHAEVAVARRNDSPLSLVLDLNAAADRLDAAVIEMGVTGVARAAAPRIPKRLRGNPPALAGRYTVLLKPAAGGPADLNTSGFLAVNILASGKAAWVGKLQDTSSVRGSAWLSPADNVAFYNPLYVRNPVLAGHTAGQLAVNADGFSGDIGWRKPPQSKGDYWRGGITAILETESSPWIAAARGVPVLAPGPMTLRLEKAFSGVEQLQGEFTALGKFVFPAGATKPKLVLNRATGLLTGSYFDGVSQRSRALHGAVLQNQLRGEGFGPGVGTTRPFEVFRAAP